MAKLYSRSCCCCQNQRNNMWELHGYIKGMLLSLSNNIIFWHSWLNWFFFFKSASKWRSVWFFKRGNDSAEDQRAQTIIEQASLWIYMEFLWLFQVTYVWLLPYCPFFVQLFFSNWYKDIFLFSIQNDSRKSVFILSWCQGGAVPCIVHKCATASIFARENLLQMSIFSLMLLS